MDNPPVRIPSDWHGAMQTIDAVKHDQYWRNAEIELDFRGCPLWVRFGCGVKLAWGYDPGD